MLFYENLEEIIFHRHEMFDVDELVILSGYVGPGPTSKLKSVPFKTSVIYGMYGSDKISQKLDHALKKLSSSKVTILYSKLAVHSKCYIWRKNANIVTALVGSANFSVSGLENPYKEVLAETTFDTFAPLNKYLNIVLENCIPCYDASVKFKKQNIVPYKNGVTQEENLPLGICRISLLGANGNVPQKSGLNWGLSSGHISLGDAYIRISKNDLQNNPTLFPPKQMLALNISKGGKKTRQNDSVEFIWDTGDVMSGLLEGSQKINGLLYPKQIASSPKKNLLGKYLRNRLNVSLDHLITRKDLENYGRTTIDISLQAEGIYYLDFSV
jgi:NgoFVII restriction endonuclease.